MVYLYKKYKINFTNQFKMELYNFLYKTSPLTNNSLISDKFYSKIMKSLFSLKIFPERYAKIYTLNNKEYSNIRRLTIDKYVIIYEVNNTTNEVFILHIFHGTKNYFNKL